MAKQTPTMSISIAVDGDSGESLKVSSNWGVCQGTLMLFKIKIPNYTNNVTTNIYLKDRYGDHLYAILDLVRNATHVVSDITLPLVEQETFVAELSGVPGGLTPYTIEVIAYYIPDHRP